MARQDKATRIWLRVLKGYDTPSFLRGDWMLESVLRTEGYVMNGGVFHAVDNNKDVEDLLDADLGYRYFGLGEVADLLREARSLVESDVDLRPLEAEMDRKYHELLPGNVLFEKFEAFLRLNESEFAPLKP